MLLEKGQFHFPLLSPLDCVDLLYANANCPFDKNKMGKRYFFLSYKKKKKRDEFRLLKSSLFFLKSWMNEQKIFRIFCSSTKNIRILSYGSKKYNTHFYDSFFSKRMLQIVIILHKNRANLFYMNYFK